MHGAQKKRYDRENVDYSTTTARTVYMQVFGFRGATGPYRLTVE